MSIIFIGTPDFAVPSLRRLAERGHEIRAVVTQPDRPSGRGRHLAPPPVKVAAEALGLNILQPATLRDSAVIGQLRSLEPEAMVALAYGQILRPEVLDIAPKGVLNVHPSLLPRWRGASPIAGAILGGDDETGVTIMLMDPGMDTGPILSQVRTPIGPDDTTGSLTTSLAEVGADLLADTLPRWLAGEIERQPQDGSLATVTRLIRKEDGAIDWTLPATEIWRRVRAYNPWPGASTTLDGEQLTIWRAWPLEMSTGKMPGLILHLESAQWHLVPALSLRSDRFAGSGIQTGDGVLALVEVQRAGKRRMDAGEFVRGAHSIYGKRFDTSER